MRESSRSEAPYGAERFQPSTLEVMLRGLEIDFVTRSNSMR